MAHIPGLRPRPRHPARWRGALCTLMVAAVISAPAPARAPSAAAAATAASVRDATAATASAATFPSSSVNLTGHGYGHGRGMGQFGALGYAIDHGWSYHQILDHYYGGTTPGHVDPATPMTVDMTSRDGLNTIAVQELGALATSPALALGCTAGAPCAVRIDRAGPATFSVFRGTGCAGGTAGWVLVASAVRATAISIASTAVGTNRQDLLQLCEANDHRWLRGRLVAQDTGNSQATINQLAVDDYVRGVVPRESPAFWGTMGGGAGEQALDAQAVAARSYALAEARWPYAKTCDTTSCQVYGGRAVQTNDGTFSDLEGTPLYASSDNAVQATAGEVRISTGTAPGTVAGATARTEFSSSTGGYSAGGTFPAVADDGDATATNPNHDWTDSIAVSDIEALYPSFGPFVSIAVTDRNGIGDLGGRALIVQLAFTNGHVTITGDGLANDFGLRSNWFAITNAAPNTPPPPPPPVEYHALTADGAVYGFAGATVDGSLASRGVQTAAVALAEVPGGYWILTADGAVYGFGTPATYGSLKGRRLNGPPRQIMATPSGKGYWIIASDGGVFSFGDAHFWGSTGSRRLNAPIVGVAPTPDGGGYWLLGADGGIFTFGDAHFFGSTGDRRLNAPVNALAPMPDGEGYWLAASDGGIFSFGSATYAGSLPQIGVRGTAVGMQAAPSGNGYLIATSSGNVYGFGDAKARGGPAGDGATAATVAIGITRPS